VGERSDGGPRNLRAHARGRRLGHRYRKKSWGESVVGKKKVRKPPFRHNKRRPAETPAATALKSPPRRRKQGDRPVRKRKRNDAITFSRWKGDDLRVEGEQLMRNPLSSVEIKEQKNGSATPPRLFFRGNLSARKGKRLIPRLRSGKRKRNRHLSTELGLRS